MNFMEYPTEDVVEGRGIIPNVPLPRDFKDLVPKFYREGGREKVERYVEMFKKSLEKGLSLSEREVARDLDIRLGWDEKKGLAHIEVGRQAGLDLNDSGGLPSFQEHNLSTGNGRIVGPIARKYVSELLKSR